MMINHLNHRCVACLLHVKRLKKATTAENAAKERPSPLFDRHRESSARRIRDLWHRWVRRILHAV